MDCVGEELRIRLERAESFGEIFSVVKKAVEEVLGVRRAGLELLLVDLPGEVGAMHQIGSNAIIMNRRHLQALLKSSRSRLEINSYIFLILLHEYLHSLGVLDEGEVAALSMKVIKEALGEDHPAYRMAPRKLAEIAEQLIGEDDLISLDDAEIIRDFDTDNSQYIG
ncbi:MAG: hypothetical protein QW330_02030 [Nitrososphaerota archaeon]